MRLISMAWQVPAHPRWIHAGSAYLLVAAPFALMWTLAILGLRLPRPRPRWRRLVRQPGLVAGMAVAAALVVRLIGYAILRLRLIGQGLVNIYYQGDINGGPTISTNAPRNSEFLMFGYSHAMNSLAVIGVAVASSWMLLGISGRWRAERSWIDRAGRALGICWIAILPVTVWWDFHTWY